MGLLKFSRMVFPFWVLTMCFGARSDVSEVSVKLLKAPHAVSRLNSATFVFEVFSGGNGICTNCSISCKLDNGIASNCKASKVFYTNLPDGNHTFEVCANVSGGIGCAGYNWLVDTVPPTAFITASATFTNALNVSVNISFTEPCTGEGNFRCSSANACNLLVYGAGQVIPSSLNTVQSNLKYSILVSLSASIQYGRVILVMDKNFCTDTAGNRFKRTANSSFFVHFDRRNVLVDVRTHIPEKLLQLNRETRTVQATNSYNNLKVYLYFSHPTVNSSREIQNSLNVSQGKLFPISGEDLGNRRFGFMVTKISTIAIITISLDSSSLISRQGTPVSPISPVTFLYDSERPAVKLSTTSNTRMTVHNIPVLVKFMKPVFGFNSSLISISGGLLQSFHEISRSIYIVEIQADGDIVSVSVPENVTEDVAGNKNLASDTLRVRHYRVPLLSFVVSTFATVVFLVTSFAAGLLTVSTASLQSAGALSRHSFSFISDPARNLFRTACHIQVFALSRWLAVALPVEYYELARGLQWSIPYFSLPWENGHIEWVTGGSNSSAGFLSKINDLGIFWTVEPDEGNLSKAAAVYGSPLTPMEYRSFFESQHIEPKAEHILEQQRSDGWSSFDRSMFWLAVIGGSLILLHVLLLLILKLRKRNSEKEKVFGALTFPRFEIFLIVLGLPCICKASAGLVRGGAPSGVIVGILLLAAVSFLLLALFLFLSIGIILGKLLQYKEVHQEGRKFHWYVNLVRVTLGPGKVGQWTWKNQSNSIYLTILGPLFEDLRGPPKYMLSQISDNNSQKHGGERIIASDDETEDAEAPFIQKLFGILRIYYTLLESVKRVTLGIIAGAYSDNWSSKTPTIVILCITSFQLFFLVLKKPFIKKKVQLVEIISVCCEVCIFGTCLVLLEKKVSTTEMTNIGIFMLIVFLFGFLSEMVNEWYALYRQTKQLDPSEKSFAKGLKIASIGFLLYFIPQKLIKYLVNNLPVNQRASGETEESGSDEKNKSDKFGLKQLRELAKASFSEEQKVAPNDPSTSQSGWSGMFWNKRSGSSSLSPSSDFKPKPRKLYKDLEDIFASR